MSPNAQRIAIAEACGITVEPCTCAGGLVKRDAKTKQHLPDYPNDLNAMHEAEKVLTPEQKRTYADLLAAYYRPTAFDAETAYAIAIGSPAAQRAEAFLHATGKLEDRK